MTDSDLKHEIPFLHGDELIFERNDSTSYPFKALGGSTRGLAGGDLKQDRLFTLSSELDYNGELYQVKSKDGKKSNNTMTIYVPELGIEVKDFSVLNESRHSIASNICDALKKEIETREEMRQKGRDYVVQDNISETIDTSSVSVPKTGDMHTRFTAVIGNVSELTKGINATNSLGELADIAKAFKDTKEKLESLTTTSPTSSALHSITSTIHKKLGSTKYIKGWLKTYKDSKTDAADVQSNIEYLFGLIHTKYEKLVTTGEALQQTRVNFQSQINALETLKAEAQEEIDSFIEEIDIPARLLSLHTQVSVNLEKFKQRLLKIEGSIMATSHTIMMLGKELPALKTDLTDEMAIGSLLNSVDQYQMMYQEISSLVASVTDSTAEKTYKAIENLMQIQIDDTHAIKYLADSTARGKKFANMIITKSTELSAKVAKDAVIIREVATGASLLEAKEAIKKLGAKY